MKKRKILFLTPLLGLLLSGCSFEDITSWVDSSIFTPVKDFFSGGKKEEESGDQTKTYVEIVSVSAPSSINKGETLAPSSVSLVVKYKVGSTEGTENVKAESVELNTSVAGDSVKGKAKFKSLEKEFTIKVVDPSEPVGKTFAQTVSEVNSIFASHGITDKVTLPEPAGFVYGEVADGYEDYYCVGILCESTDTVDSYYSKLESAGYTLDSDEDGDYAVKGDFYVSADEYEGYLAIYIYNFSDAGGGGGGGGGDASYTLVTSAASLENGDVVVIATSDGTGVSGFDGKKDAQVSSNPSSWVQFVVGDASSSGWTLYDASEKQYIAKPGGNEFKYAATGGVCSVDSSGHLMCENRYLCINEGSTGTYYRFYTSINDSYTPFCVYAVSGGSGEGGGGSSTESTPLSVIKQVASILFETSNPQLNTHYAYSSTYDYYYTVVSYSTATEDDLEAVVVDVASDLTFLVQDGDVEAYSEDGLTGYEVYMYSEDDSVEVCVYSFYDEDDGVLVCVQAYEA